MQLYPTMNCRDERFDKTNACLDSYSPRFQGYNCAYEKDDALARESFKEIQDHCEVPLWN